MCSERCGCNGYEVLVVQLGAMPNESERWQRINHTAIEGDSPRIRRLRELLQIDAEVAVATRGIATCRDCGMSRLLWFGSSWDARWQRSIILDELASDDVVEIRRLSAIISLKCE